MQSGGGPLKTRDREYEYQRAYRNAMTQAETVVMRELVALNEIKRTERPITTEDLDRFLSRCKASFNHLSGDV